MIVPHSIMYFTEELVEAEATVGLVPVPQVQFAAVGFASVLRIPLDKGGLEVLRAAARFPCYPAWTV